MDPKNPPASYPIDQPINQPATPSGKHCPQCGSTDIRHDIEHDVFDVITAIIPGAPSAPGINFICKKCGYRYIDVSSLF